MRQTVGVLTRFRHLRTSWFGTYLGWFEVGPSRSVVQHAWCTLGRRLSSTWAWPGRAGAGQWRDLAWEGVARMRRSPGNSVACEELGCRAVARAWERLRCAGCRGWSGEVACAQGWPEEGPNGVERRGEGSDRGRGERRKKGKDGKEREKKEKKRKLARVFRVWFGF